MKSKTLLIAMLISLAFCHICLAQTTSFSYQGNLTNSGAPANGNFDFEFKLFDAASGGAQVGATVQRLSVAVANGIYAVSLDFGAGGLTGADRFLETAVRTAGGPGGFQQLLPRQQILSTPYAVRSLNAGTAANATNFAGTLSGDVTGTQSATIIANNAVTTAKIADANVTSAKLANASVTDAKIVDVAGSKITGTIPFGAVPAGSGNYIQNQNAAPQSSSNFNISGTGTANIINAGTQFNLNGSRVLSIAGTNNLFAGVGAGLANTGDSNAFFGKDAGPVNTTGSFNSFFGRNAGLMNTTGNSNSFFGTSAGFSNGIGGDENSFFGRDAGLLNSGGFRNSFFGAYAGSFNTASNNSFFGAASGQFNTSGTLNSFFGTFAGNRNNGSFNTFLGSEAGSNVTTGNNNTISGFNSAGGCDNFPCGFDMTGSDNSFYGYKSGLVTTTASGNSFFGSGSGQATTTGGDNAFFGRDAGRSNTTANANSFFGSFSGANNTLGTNNSFFGWETGILNREGTSNSFFGTNAGGTNTIGSNNVFFGAFTGSLNTTGNNNTIIGTGANTGANNLNNATAIGAGARVDTSNSIVLGSISGVNGATANTNVGIGTTAPTSRLEIAAQDALAISGFQPFLTLRDTSAANARSVLQAANGDFIFYPNSFIGGNPAAVLMNTTGNLGIGTSAPDQKLTVNGNASKPGGGSWAVFSDERLKNLKGRFTQGLNAVMRLQPVRYKYKPDNPLGLKPDGEYVGFSAQEVAKILPEAVTKNDKGYLLINNDPIMWTMLNAIKEQQMQFALLQRQFEAQRKQLLEQRQRIGALAARLACQTRLAGSARQRGRR